VVVKLLKGHDWPIFDDVQPPPQFTEADWRAAWEELRDEIMRLHLEGFGPEDADVLLGRDEGPQPGSRPWGWWAFDAPERRRVVAGKEHPIEGKPEYYFGMPNPSRGLVEYESQDDYLRRLGLLTPEEEAALLEEANAT
jgi:hypothetical protein